MNALYHYYGLDKTKCKFSASIIIIIIIIIIKIIVSNSANKRDITSRDIPFLKRHQRPQTTQGLEHQKLP